MKLTGTKVAEAKPADRERKLSDGGGLYLLVKPNGTKAWRYKYRFNGRELTLALGVYPEVSLKQARQRHQAAREMLANGVDPNQDKRDRRLAALDAALEAEILTLRRVQPFRNGHASDSPQPAPARFCTQCGAPVEPTHQFCAGCGTKLPVPSTQSQPADSPLTDLNGIGIATLKVTRSGEANNDDTEENNNTEGSNGETTELQAISVNRQNIESTPSNTMETLTPETDPERLIDATIVSSAASSKGDRRLSGRWLGFAAVIAAVWVVGVVWFSINSRAGQEAQIPVATFANGQIQALAADNTMTLLATAQGIQWSEDGERWTAPSIDDTIFALVKLDVQRWLAAGTQGLWRSEDNGEAWQAIEIEPASLRLVALANMPGESDVLWGVDRTTLYVSHNAGQSWEVVNASLPGQVRSLAAGSTELFIGTDRGVYRSTNRGDSWTDYNGAVNGRIGTTDIQAVAFDPTGNLLFAGTPVGLFFMNLANPGGWGQRTLTANVASLTVTGDADEVLWVGTTDGKLFQSTNRGVTWQ